MTKWPIQKQTHRTTHKHVEHQGATDIQKKPCFGILLFIYNFLNNFSNKCRVTALVRSMPFIGGLNQFKAIANLTLSQIFAKKLFSEISIHL